MNMNKKIGSCNTPNLFSKEIIITKKTQDEHQLNYTYQKHLISDLDHKELSKFVSY